MRRLISYVACPLLALGAGVLAPPATAATGPVTIAVDRAPTTTLQGAATGVAGGHDLVHSGGRLYTLDDDTVRVFAPGASGDAAPARSIDVPVPDGQTGYALAVDDDGYTYVLTSNDELTSSTIFVYAPGASGDAAYTSVSNGFLGLLSPIDITDHGDGIAVLDNDSNGIYFYDSFRTSPAQTGGIDAGSGTQTKVFGPSTIDTAPSGKLVVRGQNFVSVFAKDADGDVAPLQYLEVGTRTRIGVPLGAGMDKHGVLVLATADDYETAAHPRILSFAPGATGAVAPQAVLAGPKADLQRPYVDVAADGTLAVASYGSTSAAFTGGISLFRGLGPYAAPAKPGPLTVGGAASAARRTLAWKNATTDPDTPVTGYVVKVVCSQSVVLSKSLPRSARKATVRLGTVRRGSCLATVKARNVVGLGANARKSFAVRR